MVSCVSGGDSIVLTCAIEVSDLALQLRKDALNHSNTVELVAVDSRRQRQLLPASETLRRAPRYEHGDMKWQSTIDLSDPQVISRDGTGGYIGDVQVRYHRHTVQNVAGEVRRSAGCSEQR